MARLEKTRQLLNIEDKRQRKLLAEVFNIICLPRSAVLEQKREKGDVEVSHETKKIKSQMYGRAKSSLL